MVELLHMASASVSPAILHPDQVLYRAPKDLQVLLPVYGSKQCTFRSNSLQLNAQHPEDIQRMHLLSDFIQSTRPSSMIEKPVPINIQEYLAGTDFHQESLLFSLGIAEKCTGHEKILKFLMSGSNSMEEEDINISLLSDHMGLQYLGVEMLTQSNVLMDDKFGLYNVEWCDSQHFLQPQRQVFIPEPFLNYVVNLTHTSVTTVNPDGRDLFTSNGGEMKDLLSLIAEFSVPKKSTNGSKQSMLVPYFTRKGRGCSKANSQVPPSKLQSQVASPLKSPDNIKLKPLHKKKQKKLGKVRDLYQRNYFHTCEILLSLVLHKNSGSKAILSLKKSGPEIGQLLTQMSAGIAGTGLAVIFSVMCKVACGKVPLGSIRLLSTGLGFGLFWLSWAVNGLRDTIMLISKNSSKLNLNEEEIAEKVERSMHEILFRAAALVSVAVLRLA